MSIVGTIRWGWGAGKKEVWVSVALLAALLSVHSHTCGLADNSYDNWGGRRSGGLAGWGIVTQWPQPHIRLPLRALSGVYLFWAIALLLCGHSHTSDCHKSTLRLPLRALFGVDLFWAIAMLPSGHSHTCGLLTAT